MIKAFQGKYACFSNFYIESDGTHVEGEFQAAKTITLEQRMYVMYADASCKIRRSPREAKRIGRETTLRQDWELIKYDRMWKLVLDKFDEWADLGEILLGTDNQQLIEGNRHGDTTWGMTLDNSGKLVTGENYLGRILMTVRDQLRGR